MSVWASPGCPAAPYNPPTAAPTRKPIAAAVPRDRPVFGRLLGRESPRAAIVVFVLGGGEGGVGFPAGDGRRGLPEGLRVGAVDAHLAEALELAEVARVEELVVGPVVADQEVEIVIAHLLAPL